MRTHRFQSNVIPSHVRWSASRPIANVGGSLEMYSVPVSLAISASHCGTDFTNVSSLRSTPSSRLKRSCLPSHSIAA